MVIVAENNVARIERLELGPFGTNAYILVCRKTRESALVDAPAEGNTIIEKLKDTTPRYILLTHNHMDHTGALAQLRDRLKVPLAAHASDAVNLASPPEMVLNNGNMLPLGNLTLEVLHTPGHTKGSLCFLLGRYLISGDTIFPGGPGKTSSPVVFKQIVDSIIKQIFVLPDDTRIFPGHGDATIVKKERNEFSVFSSRTHSPDLCGDVLWLTA